MPAAPPSLPASQPDPVVLLPPTPAGRPRRAWLAGCAWLAVAGVAATPAAGWTEAAQAEIVRDAARLMPESLRELMARYDGQLLAGMLRPGSPEDQPEHWQHPDGAYGTAAARARQDAEAIAAAVAGRESFAVVVQRFGALAHWIADINHPLHAADRDPALAGYYVDYERYLEQQLPRYPLVFHGYRAEALATGGPSAYLLGSAGRSRDYARFVRRAYDDRGRRVSAQAFDERSLAFGVGSLAYSHAVNDIVRVWLWAWERAGGDTTRTPYPLAAPPGGALSAANRE